MLIFEMVAGYPPFYSENKVEMFKAICDVKYSFPPHFSRVSLSPETFSTAQKSRPPPPLIGCGADCHVTLGPTRWLFTGVGGFIACIFRA